MGSDNISTQPKRNKLRGYLSSTLLLLGSFFLPFVMLGILTSTRRLPDPRHSPFPTGIRGTRPSGKRPLTKRSPSKSILDLVNPPPVPQQASLPFVMENLPKPCSGCPVVQSISPNSGSAAQGTSITITGHSFGTSRTLNAVSIGSVPCISFEYVDSSTVICKASPATLPSHPPPSPSLSLIPFPANQSAFEHLSIVSTWLPRHPPEAWKLEIARRSRLEQELSSR